MWTLLSHHAAAVLASVVVTLLCLLCSPASAINFKMPADTQRCFVEEIPSGADFKLTYAATLGFAQFIDVKLYNPNDDLIFDDVAKIKGSYTSAAQSGGDYRLCFFSRTVTKAKVGKQGEETSIAFSLKVASEGIDYEGLATREKLRPMEIQLRMMEDTVRSIHGEYVYYKEKEAEMRGTNEHMTAKVVWMAILVIIIFIAFSYLQLRHLKSYFRKKRMID